MTGEGGCGGSTFFSSGLASALTSSYIMKNAEKKSQKNIPMKTTSSLSIQNQKQKGHIQNPTLPVWPLPPSSFCVSQSTRASLVDNSKRGKVSRKRRGRTKSKGRELERRGGVRILRSKAASDLFIAGLMRKSAKVYGQSCFRVIKKRVSDLKRDHMQCIL